MCGWVHFNCSGLKNKTDFHENFLCAKCSKNRVIIEDDDPFAVAYTKIHNAYTNPKKSTAFGSRQNLLRETICLPKDVDRYLKSSETYTKFKLTRKRFPKLKVVSYRLNEIWSIDLADMQQLAAENSGIRYLLVAVDRLSRFLWVTGLKSKTSRACTGVLKKIIIGQRNAPKICATKFSPGKIWADQGREFAGDFAQFRNKNGIQIYSTRSETKSALPERSIRTLKSIIFRYLHEHDTIRYIDQLDKFVSIINNRINRMTKLAPIAVFQKDVPYLLGLCNSVPPRQPKFKVGDRVRIPKKIETFHRGYRIQFTEELFTTSHIPTENRPTYVVKDVNDEIIQGKFYEPELVKFLTTISSTAT